MIPRETIQRDRPVAGHGRAEPGGELGLAGSGPARGSGRPVLEGRRHPHSIRTWHAESVADGTQGVLVVAGTPIGDPTDASPRLRAELEGADVVAAEDTRRTRRLAADLGIALRGRVVSYYDAVERERLPSCSPPSRRASASCW